MTFPSTDIRAFLRRCFPVFFVMLNLACIPSTHAQQANFEYDKNIPERPSPPRLVNDFAGMLSENDLANLEKKLVAYNDSTSTQIAVVIIPSLDGYAEDDYAIRLGRKWGIGQKGKNNGLLILISKEDRAVDIETGYGLESYVSDRDCKHIIDEIIIPQFKQSNYYEGINDATDKIIGLLQGTYTFDESKDVGSNNGGSGIPTWAIIVIIIVIFFIILPNIGGGGGNGWTGGSRGWTTGGGGWSSGGGGWSSGGGGFGGFGGGSFGGGGASGRW